MLRQNFPTHEENHQYRNYCDRDQGGCTHRERLCVGQRTEHPALLRLKTEHGKETDGDDQKTEKECWTYFFGSVGDDSRMRFFPTIPFEVFVSVFNHYNRGINHHSYSDSDST
ncbi:hypothetical protein BMS3Bbin04_01811 [bacterium BMS3Bbin04]|nr:hypothetical protein BMS3Bbin04_01811 [bacterium BMS3Bbin04]